jgi:ribosomal-protein-serine acetyltransferase
MFSAVIRPGLELRLLEERHSSTVYPLADRNREHLREWFAWVDATKSEDDILAFIRRSLNQFASNLGFSAGIWEQSRYAGNISLHKVDWLNRRAEIGYWLGREFQGRGIVTDACRAVTRHALVELDLNRVEIRCATGNAKSKAIPLRLGFTLEGVLRQAELLHERYVDLEVYSMLRSEFAQAAHGRSAVSIS